jgi:L-iditol 2-dehydrogenase
MKALVKYAPGTGDVDILDVEEPSCGENQVKVEVAYCGVCGTDIHVSHATTSRDSGGHEFAGAVVEVGRNVAGVKKGERIAGLGATAITCGECEYPALDISSSARTGVGWDTA